jgi:hypothetical protein
VLEKWKWVPILFTLEKVTLGATIANLTQALLHALFNFGGLNEQVVGQKLVSFGINGGNMFINVCNGITTQIKHDVVPFSVPIHCVAHKIDLVVKTLSTQLLVDNI